MHGALRRDRKGSVVDRVACKGRTRSTLMARWKKPTSAETRTARQQLTERARRGDLRLPDAIPEIRRAFGLNQEEVGKLVGLTRGLVPAEPIEEDSPSLPGPRA